ncbi:hypothetical protein FB451DRAFT_1402619 [Mycena latifolia]|nr:hypothetical protein FB451DRAFT_1402619 [Mycena latifolia]
MSSNPALETILVPYTLCACATILVYDWMCTLDQEISYVWSGPRSMGTLLFVLNRYLPFIDTKMTRIPPEDCLTRNKIVGWLTVLGILISEVILMLRTYAIWERRRGVLTSLSILGACTLITTTVICQLELASLEYVPTDGLGCKLARASSVVIFAYLMFIISETTIVVMTVIKAYRDWMLFYAYLLGISIANILVPIFAPSIFSNWLATCVRKRTAPSATNGFPAVLPQTAPSACCTPSCALESYYSYDDREE